MGIRCAGLGGGGGYHDQHMFYLLRVLFFFKVVFVAKRPQGWEATVLPAVAQAAVVLLQREIPDAINVAVAVHARQHGVTVILDLGGDDAPPPK